MTRLSEAFAISPMAFAAAALQSYVPSFSRPLAIPGHLLLEALGIYFHYQSCLVWSSREPLEEIVLI